MMLESGVGRLSEEIVYVLTLRRALTPLPGIAAILLAPSSTRLQDWFPFSLPPQHGPIRPARTRPVLY
jgi:hypothetical protein